MAGDAHSSAMAFSLREFLLFDMLNECQVVWLFRALASADNLACHELSATLQRFIDCSGQMTVC